MITARISGRSGSFFAVSCRHNALNTYITEKVPKAHRKWVSKKWWVSSRYILQVVDHAKSIGIQFDTSRLPTDLHANIQYSSPDNNVLYLTDGAPKYIVEAVWKAIVKKHHPDVGGDSNEFQKYKEAYERIRKHHRQD